MNMHNNEDMEGIEERPLTFKTYDDAKEYYVKHVETGDSIDHMCTSGCGNDFDCPIEPYEEWLENEEVVIVEAQELQESDNYDELTKNK